MFICGLKKYHLLHSCVGCTADVTGNGLQAARMETGHHRSQIPVEPELKVFRPKACKFRSKGCQGNVQDGVSYTWICEEGDVFLQIKRFMVQCREATTLLSSFWKWMQAWWHIYSGVSVTLLSRSGSTVYHFEPNLGPLLASAKSHWAQHKFHTALWSANFAWKCDKIQVK